MAELHKGEIQGHQSTRPRHKTDYHWHCDCERWGENEMPETDLSESGATATDNLKKTPATAMVAGVFNMMEL